MRTEWNDGWVRGKLDIGREVGWIDANNKMHSLGVVAGKTGRQWKIGDGHRANPAKSPKLWSRRARQGMLAEK